MHQMIAYYRMAPKLERNYFIMFERLRSWPTFPGCLLVVDFPSLLQLGMKWRNT